MWNEDSLNYAEKEICRFATEHEKLLFFEKLEKEYNRKWNSDIKEFEYLRWRPKENETFYYIDVDGTVKHLVYYKSITFFNKFFNCFKTQEAAQRVADQIKKIFKNSKTE